MAKNEKTSKKAGSAASKVLRSSSAIEGGQDGGRLGADAAA